MIVGAVGQRGWFYAGLFLITSATLSLELLNTRLLSVMAWYHLAFFAVSMAMFGMSAGAIRVYLGGEAYGEAQARRALFRSALALALVIPAGHLVSLCIPLQTHFTVMTVVSLILVSVTLAIPFFVSGIAVAIALTRIAGPSGLVYAVDLLGAALGSLLVIPMLKVFDASSATIATGALAAAGAFCFGVFADGRRRWSTAILTVFLLVCAPVNAMVREGIRVVHIKGGYVPSKSLIDEAWTIHGRVDLHPLQSGRPFYWGPGTRTEKYKANFHELRIDGEAATPITQWDGKPESLDWVQHDVTALAYHLRKNGDAGVIGVGGGRDVLTALWARSAHVTGVEINEVQLRHLNGKFRDFANIANRTEVRLVHDEARSYFTRTTERFDVLQMSLIDTWAATGAGAFTLSENGLYTTGGWSIFLRVLKPTGIFSVSRWYTRGRDSETSRLLSLATASLLEFGVPDPSKCMALVARESVATLLVTPEPLSARDLEQLRATAERFGFSVLLSPDAPPTDPLLLKIYGSQTRAQLEAAVYDPAFDYTPPTDQRPFFFNTLKPAGLFAREMGTVQNGNLLATRTLILLWLVAFVMVVIAILGPLARSGLPKLEQRSFGHAVMYFALIGTGFMWVQIPLMQRFSVYLGHPTYAVAIIMFSMILSTGIGSLISDRMQIERDRRWIVAIPLGIAAILLAMVMLIQPLIQATISANLITRALIVAFFVLLAALPLGFCFPMGLRLVKRLSDDAMPWMWGINGAAGVLASASAVAISMWASIDANLMVAIVVYGLLVIPASALWNRGAALAQPIVEGPSVGLASGAAEVAQVSQEEQV